MIRGLDSPCDISSVKTCGHRLIGTKKETLLFSSVSNCHDIHVSEFWSGLSPVTVGQDLVPTDFGSGLDFHATRHSPMKQSIEPSHSDTPGRRFHVFQER
jgi:hypothetical protein